MGGVALCSFGWGFSSDGGIKHYDKECSRKWSLANLGDVRAHLHPARGAIKQRQREVIILIAEAERGHADRGSRE